MYLDFRTLSKLLLISIFLLVLEDCITVPGSMSGQVGQFKPQGFIPDISLFGLILWGSEILARVSLSLRLGGLHRWILKNLLHPRILDHDSPMFKYNGGDTRQLRIKRYRDYNSIWFYPFSPLSLRQLL